jgi:hypothetical protein
MLLGICRKSKENPVQALEGGVDSRRPFEGSGDISGSQRLPLDVQRCPEFASVPHSAPNTHVITCGEECSTVSTPL